MGEFPGVGTLKLSKCPGSAAKKEGKCPAPWIDFKDNSTQAKYKEINIIRIN